MVTVEVERTYVAPVSRVWDKYTDHAGWTEWAGAGRVRLAREGKEQRDGVGCLRVIENPGVAVREEITEFEPHRRMRYRLLDDPGIRDHEGEVTFDDLGGHRTRVVWRCSFEPKIPGSGWLLHKGVSFFFSRVLRRLARVL